MDQERSHIRQEIEQTREALVEKIEMLENKVERVKRTVDLEYQAARNPWTVVGISAASGLVLGLLVSGRRKTKAIPSFDGASRRGSDGVFAAITAAIASAVLRQVMRRALSKATGFLGRTSRR